ncbi:zinc finger protein 37-like [Branchiostoma lanceolatum]|uniref:zinc finger protein 37-like n=1 Tax=Branchiostoma lanceolatum TaxID=7740 RepID=UPI0034537C2A
MSQKEQPYGLSKVVTLAVLPRLYMEELVLELGRRNVAAQNSSNREDLINTLADVIMHEFCGLTTVSFQNTSNNEEHPSESREADSRSCENSTPTTEVSNSRLRIPGAVSNISAIQKRKWRENQTATSSSVEITPPRQSQENTVTNVSAIHKRKQGENETATSSSVEITPPRQSQENTVTNVSAIHKRKQGENETATSSSVEITPPRQSHLENPEEHRSKKQLTDKQHSATVTSTEEPSQATLSRQLSKGSVENESLQLENSPSSDVVFVKVEPALDRENVGQNSWRDFRQTTEVAQDQADVGSGANEYLVRMEDYDMQGEGRRRGDVHGGLGNTGEVVSEWCVEQNVILDGGVSMEMGQTFLNQQQQEMEMPEASCSTGKLHRCPHCSYTTTWSSVLTRHLRTHTGEKPFKCPACDYSASQKGTLDRHMAVHRGERPFVCVECGYRAADKSRLTRHFKTHSLNRLYVCELCGFSTQDGSLLIAHEVTHTAHPADPGVNTC